MAKAYSDEAIEKFGIGAQAKRLLFPYDDKLQQPATIDAPLPATTAKNQMKTMAMADDARLMRPSQPAVPNKPVSQDVKVDTQTPMFTNNAAFAKDKNLTIDRGDGIMGNVAGDFGEAGGGLTIVKDLNKVVVTPDGNGFVASQGSAADMPPQGKQPAAPAAMTIDGPLLNTAPTSSDILSGVSLGSDYGSIKAIQLANALATDGFNRQQTNIANVNRERKLDQDDLRIDQGQQAIDAEIPDKAAQTRLRKAQAEAAEYENSPEGRKASTQNATAKIQRDYDKDENDLFQKTYSDILKSYEGTSEAITDEQRIAAENQANGVVARRRDQREYASLSPEDRAAVDGLRAKAEKQRQRNALLAAYRAVQAKGDTAGMAEIADKMAQFGY